MDKDNVAAADDMVQQFVVTAKKDVMEVVEPKHWRLPAVAGQKRQWIIWDTVIFLKDARQITKVRF